MNGGVIIESTTQFPSAPVFKQELITEHYAVTAKRPSQRDKMNRPLRISTGGGQVDLNSQPSPYMTAPAQVVNPQGVYPGYAPGPFQPPTGQFYVYPSNPSQAVPGPSRRHSHASVLTPTSTPQQVMYDALPFDPSSAPYNPPTQTWETASVTSATSQHKRKRSNSSQLKEEVRTPRKGSQALPDADVRSHKRRYSSGTSGPTQLPTPPSTGGNVSTPNMSTQPADDKPLETIEERSSSHGTYITSTAEEGRKLGLFQFSNGSEAVEDLPPCGPPRTSTTTVLSIAPTGLATVSDDAVLRSEVSLLGQSTPGGPASKVEPVEPQTPTNQASPQQPEDTPRTKDGKIKQRLAAFDTVSRATEPMFSIRLDMGQGHLSRIALRKDMALAFIGYDKSTKVVEERRREDEDAWAASTDAGEGPVRPNWPDDEAPWKVGHGGRSAKQLREDRERVALLRRYLETSSDDDEDAVFRPTKYPTRKGKNVIRVRKPSPSDVLKGSQQRQQQSPAGASDEWEIYPSDARTALMFALRKGRRRQMKPVMPAGVIACSCKQTTGSGSMISCSTCKTWHHLVCVGLDEVQIAPNWSCGPCVGQARRATLTPSGRTPASYLSAERSLSAFRGNQAVALAPSPMFAGEAARVASSVTGTEGARTPYSPTRSGQRARVLSYGNDLWGVGTAEDPSTPVAPARLADHFSTPRIDEPVFDVNSTPSRHLNSDPRMSGPFGGSLFSMTPLLSRSRNAANLIPGDTPTSIQQPGRRNPSGIPPFSEGVANRHQFLQGLAVDGGDRRLPATERPGSPSSRRGGPSILAAGLISPSPFSLGSGHRRSLSSNKFSHLRSSSRSGLGLGTLFMDDDDRQV